MQDFETFEYSLVTKLDVKVKGYMTMTGKIRYNTPPLLSNLSTTLVHHQNH